MLSTLQFRRYVGAPESRCLELLERWELQTSVAVVEQRFSDCNACRAPEMANEVSECMRLDQAFYSI